MLPARPVARRFVEARETESLVFGPVMQILNAVPARLVNQLHGYPWKEQYHSLLGILASMDEDMIEDLATLGIGHIYEQRIRQLAAAGDLNMYILWIRSVRFFGADVVVFKLVGNMAELAAWQRGRFPWMIQGYLDGMSDTRQALRVLALRGLAELAYHYRIHLLESWSRAFVTSDQWQEDFKDFFSVEEDTDVDSDP
jgi:hypothetical protein